MKGDLFFTTFITHFILFYYYFIVIVVNICCPSSVPIIRTQGTFKMDAIRG